MIELARDEVAGIPVYSNVVRDTLILSVVTPSTDSVTHTSTVVSSAVIIVGSTGKVMVTTQKKIYKTVAISSYLSAISCTTGNLIIIS